MKGLIIVVLAILAFAVPPIYLNTTFDIDIGGHMKRASDANTIELATQEMRVVVTNMEQRGMTEGYTSVIYRTPDEDVGYWYDNMNSSLKELESINPNASQLEKSNVLMKLRESLTDSEESGSEIKIPPGISRYPNNLLWVIVGLISIFLMCAGMYVYSNE